MKKILFSIATLGIVGALAIGATTAIFSDDEVSTGNTFTAGAIDLKIDNESYYNGERNEGTSWIEPVDLEEGTHFFFKFDDLKPGDYGEDTISLHVLDNESWVCVDLKLTENADNGSTEPELIDEDPYTADVGELIDQVQFMWWADDGDNVLESDETVINAGSLSGVPIGQTVSVALADSQNNIWGTPGEPFPGDVTRYIGKAWCFGEMTEQAVTPGDNDPLIDPGFSCDGSGINNVTQTDSMAADITFHVEQSRHNDQFLCEPLPEITTITVRKAMVNDDGGTAQAEEFTLKVNDTTVQSAVPTEFPPDTYTISEEGPTEGYDAVFSGACDEIGDTNTATLTVGEFEQAICIITNDDVGPGSLTMDKEITFSDSSLTMQTTNFPFTITNDLTLEETVVIDGDLPVDLEPGTYTITEEYIGPHVGTITYTVTFSDDCSEIGDTDTGTITIEEDGVYLCTVTNEVTVID